MNRKMRVGMKTIFGLALTISLLSVPAFAKATAKNPANSGRGQGILLANCTTAIQRNLVQVRGDGNQVNVVVTGNGRVIGNLLGTRKVKGNVRAANLEIEYQGLNGFLTLSCNSEPAGLIRLNGATDYVVCNSGPDAQAIRTCNRSWNSRR